VTLDGKRPLIGEVQALLATPSGGSPRRAVSGMERRLSEAARQGFTVALIPDGDDPRRDIVPRGMRALRAPTIVAALQHMIDIAERRGGPANPYRLDA
jgi:DNA repair protein RadA/Sms